MTKREIAALACRILGILTIIGAVQVLAVNVAVMQRTSSGNIDSAWLLHNLVLVPLMLVAAFVLWSYAEPLAERMAPETTIGTRKSHHSNAEIEELAFSIVALMALTRAVPDFMRFVASLAEQAIQWNSQHYDGIMFNVHPSPPSAVFIVTELIMGFGLLLAPKRIAEKIRALRAKVTTQKRAIYEQNT